MTAIIHYLWARKIETENNVLPSHKQNRFYFSAHTNHEQPKPEELSTETSLYSTRQTTPLATTRTTGYTGEASTGGIGVGLLSPLSEGNENISVTSTSTTATGTKTPLFNFNIPQSALLSGGIGVISVSHGRSRRASVRSISSSIKSTPRKPKRRPSGIGIYGSLTPMEEENADDRSALLGGSEMGEGSENLIHENENENENEGEDECSLKVSVFWRPFVHFFLSDRADPALTTLTRAYSHKISSCMVTPS